MPSGHRSRICPGLAALDPKGGERVAIVNQGGDADATGALASMLAGATYGVEALPQQWLARLDPGVTAEIQARVPALPALSATRA